MVRAHGIRTGTVLKVSRHTDGHFASREGSKRHTEFCKTNVICNDPRYNVKPFATTFFEVRVYVYHLSISDSYTWRKPSRETPNRNRRRCDDIARKSGITK